MVRIEEDVPGRHAAFDEPLVPACGALSGPRRAVAVLRDVEGLAYAKAATALGTPVGTVTSRPHRVPSRRREPLEP